MVILSLSCSVGHSMSCGRFFSKEVVTLETITQDVRKLIVSALKVGEMQDKGTLVLSSKYSFKDNGLAIDTLILLDNIVSRNHQRPGQEFNYDHFFQGVKQLKEITKKMSTEVQGLSLQEAKSDFESMVSLVDTIYKKHEPLHSHLSNELPPPLIH